MENTLDLPRGASRRVVAGNTGNLSVTEFEGSDPSLAPLCLIHGVNMDQSIWFPAIALLGGKRRVITFDLRGHGGSTYTGPFHYRHYVEDVERVLEELGSGPARVVGVSMGGVVGCSLAQKRPDLVESVVAFGSAMKAERPGLVEAMGRLRALGVDKYFAEIFPSELAKIASRGRNADTVEQVTVSGFSLDANASEFETKRPVLVANGSLDSTCTPEAGQALAAASGGIFLEVPKGGHVIPLDDPQRAVDILNGFWAEVDSSSNAPLRRILFLEEGTGNGLTLLRDALETLNALRAADSLWNATFVARRDHYDVDKVRTQAFSETTGACWIDVSAEQEQELVTALSETEVTLDSLIVAIGTVEARLPRGNPVHLILGARRRSGMSSQEFNNYWSWVHAAHAVRVLGSGDRPIGYELVHIDLEATARASAAGLGRNSESDGFVHLSYGAAADYAAVGATAGYRTWLREDESHFLDFTAPILGGEMHIQSPSNLER